MSFFYYAGDTTRDSQVLPLRRNLAARFGQGPSRRGLSREGMSAIARRLVLFASQVVHLFDRFLHRAIEGLATSKLRRINRELQLRGVRYRNNLK
jgi:hypothetical protein